MLKTTELRKALKVFALEALQCASIDNSAFGFERFRLHGGQTFNISDAAIEAQSNFVRKAIKSLGPIKGHPQVLDRALWDFVVSVANQGDLEKNSVLNNALELIEAKSASVCEFFRPCPLVLLPDGVDRIQIGRVAIDRTEARIEEFRKLNPQLKFCVGQEWTLSLAFTGNESKVETALPPTVWSIDLAAADPIREEEGLWLTDVALSILRMCVKRSDLGVLAPTVGKIEPHPFFPHDPQDHSFALKQDGSVKVGGLTAANNYWLTTGAAETLEQSLAKSKIDRVFAAKPKSVAERFYQGCGWLTRGRRSKDRSDRLLYFFTAIEALLSDSDKTSPVIQTIARHAAVILSKENDKRGKIAADIKQLYSVRSALVHSGARGAFDIDANSAQNFAELLFAKVWHNIDLSISHQEFSSILGKASFGLVLTDLLTGSSADS